MNKEGNNNAFVNYIFIISIILCQIFRYKMFYIEPNHILETNITNIIYPFTFILILLYRNKTSFKEAHYGIIKTCFIFMVFMLAVSLLNIIPSSSSSMNTDMALKQIFTPNSFTLNKYMFYYPSIINILSYTLLFYFSHTIMIILYEAMEPYTNKFINCALSMFIPLTLDTLCFTTINDVFNEIEFNTMILHLTSNFVIVIISTLLLSFIYTLINKKNKI